MQKYKNKIPIEEFNKIAANKRIGERIRTIREAKKIKRGELGKRVGLDANRMQQYETGQRKPRLELIKKIASALDVKPIAIQNPAITYNIGFMYGLFELETFYNLKLKKIDDQIYLYFENTSYDQKSKEINNLIAEWFEQQQKRDDALITASTDEERENIINNYNNWEWNYPELQVEETPEKIKEEQLEKRIAELQKELDTLRKNNG